MTVQTLSVTPLIVEDDGQWFIFCWSTGNTWKPYLWTGYMHKPVSASEPVGNPPVTWAETSDLDTWTETIKYAFRNNKQITIIYDDDGTKATQVTTACGNTHTLMLLYAVAG